MLHQIQTIIDVRIFWSLFCYNETMTERILLQPPEIVETTKPVIFLAGPIQGGPDWQCEAANLIHDLDPNVIVASPRKDYP